MSLAISIPGEDGVNIDSDGYLAGEITVSELSDERFAGTIDVVLNDIGIDVEGDTYEVTGSFDLQESSDPRPPSVQGLGRSLHATPAPWSVPPPRR